MKTEGISPALIKMINHRHLRKIFSRRIDNYIYKKIVDEADGNVEFISSSLFNLALRDWEYIVGLREKLNLIRRYSTKPMVA